MMPPFARRRSPRAVLLPALVLALLAAAYFAASTASSGARAADADSNGVVGPDGVLRRCFALPDTGRFEALSPRHFQTDDDNNNAEHPSATRLIIVPGHGVLRGLDARAWRDSHNWALEPFQRPRGRAFVATLGAHVARGVSLLKARLNESLLVFSGGETRRGAGPRSEAASYYAVAEAGGLLDGGGDETNNNNNNNNNNATDGDAAANSPVRARVFAEEFARDSFENVLYSICRFREATGRYPTHITVVGFGYKRRRFVALHRRALRFPQDRFDYVGIDMPLDTSPGAAPPLSDAGTFAATAKDPYLCRANVGVRRARNPQHQLAPYLFTCPQLEALFLHCGPGLFQGPLPWSADAAEEAASEWSVA